MTLPTESVSSALRLKISRDQSLEVTTVIWCDDTTWALSVLARLLQEIKKELVARLTRAQLTKHFETRIYTRQQ